MNEEQKSKWVELPPDTQPKLWGIFTKDRRFYKTFFPLLLVVALQQLAALTLNMADNIMLGTYTELALSGATLVNQIQFILQQICAGIGLGIVVLGSQYWGQQKIEPIQKIISIGVKCGLLVGVIFFALSMLIPSTVLGIFTDDQAVIEEGMRYLRVICWTYIIFGLSNSLMYSLQSVETATIGTIMSVSTIIINVCLNYCLIYGNFGFPELGIVGAAIATLFSRSVELMIVIIYLLFIDKKLHMKLKDIFQMDFTYLKDYIHVATPVIVSGMLWGVAQGAQTAVLGHIGATVIAANSIAVVIFQIFAVFGMSCANAASVTIGKTVGEGRLHMVKTYAKTLQGIFLLIGVFFGGAMFLAKGIIVDIYTVSEETKALALQFLTVLSITTVGTCYEYPVEGGIIAGGGNTKYQAWVDNLFMWLFTIPTAFLSAFVFNFPPVVTFAFLKADQILKCIPNAVTCNRYRWVKVLTKDDETESAVMDDMTKAGNIITVSREFGSGGRELGKEMAEILGYVYYDREIIASIAEKSGFNENYIEKALGEQVWKKIPLSNGNTFAGCTDVNNNYNKLLAEQRRIVETLGKTGENCVIIGRNAGEILKSYRPFNIFVRASLDAKIQRCMEHKQESENLSIEELKERIMQVERNRNQTRGWQSDAGIENIEKFHLVVDTTGWKIKSLAPLISEIAKKRFAE